MAETDKVFLRTYNTAWKFERKIYAIDRFRLIVPINPDEAVYFIGSEVFIYLAVKVLPLLNVIPFVLLYIALPYLMTKFLTKKKLDGKLPHKFLASYIAFLSLPKKISRFQPATGTYKKGKFSAVVYRALEVINMTKELTKGKVIKGGKSHI